jgi:hypothetical protein
VHGCQNARPDPSSPPQAARRLRPGGAHGGRPVRPTPGVAVRLPMLADSAISCPAGTATNQASGPGHSHDPPAQTECSFGSAVGDHAGCCMGAHNGGSRVTAVISDRDTALQMLESTSDLIESVCARTDLIARDIASRRLGSVYGRLATAAEAYALLRPSRRPTCGDSVIMLVASAQATHVLARVSGIGAPVFRTTHSRRCGPPRAAAAAGPRQGSQAGLAAP